METDNSPMTDFEQRVLTSAIMRKLNPDYVVITDLEIAIGDIINNVEIVYPTDWVLEQLREQGIEDGIYIPLEPEDCVERKIPPGRKAIWCDDCRVFHLAETVH